MDDKTVRTIFYLSRLREDKNKSEKIKNDLKAILEMVNSLKEIDTDKILPLHNPLEETSRVFEDAVNSDNEKSLFLENAPESDGDYFIVPKVVEWQYNFSLLVS